MYFTPGEASAYIINVQKRLFGIGAALRDDLNGLTVTQIAENGPSAKSKLLKLKDRIVAVNGESIIGMEQKDAINLIRGEEGSSVTLTIVREKAAPDSDEQNSEQKKEEILDITIVRGEVIFKETRFDKEIEPYGDGVIACIKLYSFYQTPSYSSSKDILETPLLQDSLKAIRNKLDNEWKNSPLRDVEGREKIFFLVKAIDEFEAMLISEIETGKLASEQIK